MATRLRGRFGYPADEPFRVTLHPDRLEEPLRWKKPQTIFIVSMGDLFHKDVPDEFIDRVFAIIALASWHRFMVLTKRPERAFQWFAEVIRPKTAPGAQGAIGVEQYTNAYLASRENIVTQLVSEEAGRYADSRWPDGSARNIAQYQRLITRYYAANMDEAWPPPNLCLGVSVENQQTADERIPWLLKCPAPIRFISYEPALGPVHLGPWLPGRLKDLCPKFEGAPVLNWVVAGAESGPGARPAHPDWFGEVRNQCQAAGVPFFVKAFPVNGRVSKKMEEWPEEARVREFPS